MKHTLKWHEDCLSNSLSHLEDQKRSYESYVKNAAAAIERLAREAAYYEAQIEAARTQGKDSFDSKRFKIKLRRYGATVRSKDGKTPYGVTEILAPDIDSAHRMLDKHWSVIRVSEVKE